MTTVAATTQGGREISRTIDASDAVLGYETGTTRPPAWLDIAFCDYPFTDADASPLAHVAAVERDCPEIAVAPDLEGDADPDAVLLVADRLATVADHVVVVPKAINPGDVPDRFRVGVPLADYGSDAPWQWDAYADAGSLHLLGGSPTLQLEFARYVDGVESVDGASVLKGASMGTVWAPTRDRHWHETGGGQMDYYERVRTSLDNIVEAWRVHRTGETGEYTVPADPEAWDEHARPAVERVESRAAYHRRGARGARPSISPHDADCMDTDGFLVIDWAAERERAEAAALADIRDAFDQPTLAEAVADGGDGA